MIAGKRRPASMRAFIEMHGFFDDSGDFTSPGPSYLVGWLADLERWNAFSTEWLRLARSHGMSHLHTADFLSGSGDHRDTNFDDMRRGEILAEFIGVIRKHVFGGYAIGLDPALYRALLPQAKKPGPDVFCMLRLMRYAAEHATLWDTSDFLECAFDESEKNAHRFLTAWQKLKRRTDVSRNFLASILFGDDKILQPLQAADLLGVAVRRKMAGTLPAEHPLNTLFNATDPAFGPLVTLEIWDEAKFQSVPALAEQIAISSAKAKKSS